jgi:hypothetical protein
MLGLLLLVVGVLLLLLLLLLVLLMLLQGRQVLLILYRPLLIGFIGRELIGIVRRNALELGWRCLWVTMGRLLAVPVGRVGLVGCSVGLLWVGSVSLGRLPVAVATSLTVTTSTPTWGVAFPMAIISPATACVVPSSVIVTLRVTATSPIGISIRTPATPSDKRCWRAVPT